MDYGVTRLWDSELTNVNKLVLKKRGLLCVKSIVH